MKKYITYCPLCNKEILYEVETEKSYVLCNICGHHLVVKEVYNEN